MSVSTVPINAIGTTPRPILDDSVKSALDLLITLDLVKPNTSHVAAIFLERKNVFAAKMREAIELYDPTVTGRYLHLSTEEILKVFSFHVIPSVDPESDLWHDLCSGLFTYKGVEITANFFESDSSWELLAPRLQEKPFNIRSSHYLQLFLLYFIYVINGGESH